MRIRQRHRESPPERLRFLVDETGELECRVDALLELHGFPALTPQARAAIERSLRRAGLTALPDVTTAEADQTVVITSGSGGKRDRASRASSGDDARTLERRAFQADRLEAQLEAEADGRRAAEDQLARVERRIAEVEAALEDAESDRERERERAIAMSRQAESRLEAAWAERLQVDGKAEAAQQRIAELEQALHGARAHMHAERERRAEAEQALEAERQALAAQEGELAELERIAAEAQEEAEQSVAAARQEARAIVAADREDGERLAAAVRAEAQAAMASAQEAGEAPEELITLREELAQIGQERDHAHGQVERLRRRLEVAAAEPQRESDGTALVAAERRAAEAETSLKEALDRAEAAERVLAEGAYAAEEPGPAEDLDGAERLLFEATPRPLARSPESGGRRRRRFRRRGPLERSGVCGVCQTPYHAEDAAGLVADGWVIDDETALCFPCQGKGWKLPPGASVPQRRYSDRQHA